MNTEYNHAEMRCLMMMAHRAKAMAFYIVMFGGVIALLKNPEDLNQLAAMYVVGLFGLVSLYQLALSCFFTRHRFSLALAGVQDDTTRAMIRRENSFRRIAYAFFIILAFIFTIYLGFFNG